MKIASLAPSNTEILYEIGAGEDVIATTSLCDHPPEALQLPSVGGWSEGSDMEALRELDPDIVFTSDDLQESVRDRIDFAEVVHVAPKTMEEVYASIIRIGRSTGNIEEAERTVENMKSGIEKLEVEGSPRVYCEEWSEPPMVSGNWIPGLLESAGIDYIIDEGERSRELKEEEVQDFDPDHIFMNICGASQNVTGDRILQRDGWKDLDAVMKGNVHVVDDSLLNRPGPRLVKGLKEIVGHLNGRRY